MSIRDYSCKGLALQIEDISGLSIGDTVSLHGTFPIKPFEASYIIDHFLKINKLVIRRVTDGLQQIVGLQANSESE